MSLTRPPVKAGVKVRSSCAGGQVELGECRSGDAVHRREAAADVDRGAVGEHRPDLTVDAGAKPGLIGPLVGVEGEHVGARVLDGPVAVLDGVEAAPDHHLAAGLGDRVGRRVRDARRRDDVGCPVDGVRESVECDVDTRSVLRNRRRGQDTARQRASQATARQVLDFMSSPPERMPPAPQPTGQFMLGRHFRVSVARGALAPQMNPGPTPVEAWSIHGHPMASTAGHGGVADRVSRHVATDRCS